MNTLKIKVLLINLNFTEYLLHSTLIWFVTGITGSLIVGFVYQVFAIIPPLPAFGLSLLLSSPAIILALPVFYLLPFIQNRLVRAAFAIVAILLVSAIVIGITTTILNESYSFVAGMLFPFIPTATLCFFLVARKQIMKS